MNITVTFKHMDSSDAVKSYAESKISKLEKYLNNILEAHLTLSMERVEHKESGIASLKLIAKNLDINAEEKSSDIYSAIDLLMAKVEPMIKKHKEKTRRKESSHNGEGVSYKEELALSDFEGASADVGLEIKDDYERNPLSIEDALQKIKKKNRNFIIFKNKVSLRIAFIFKEDDGIFSLIEPNL